MSSRVLKKLSLQGNSDIPHVEEDNNTDEDFSSSSFNRKFNRYDVLNDDTQSESEIKEDDGNESTESLNNFESVQNNKDTKRKKKKKKRRNNKQVFNARSSEDHTEDDFERSIREVNELLGQAERSDKHKSSSLEEGCSVKMSLLKVEPCHLNTNNEFKRMFGSKIMNISAEFKRKARSRIRSIAIINPKDTWLPIMKQGISMKLLEKKNNDSYFTFEHSRTYQNVQRDFLSAVSSLTPDDIVAIINNHPFHVDALIQLSEVCKFGEDHAMAAELIERAVYALESAFHPSFNVCRGDCRLSYFRQENRSFYVAVMKHIQFIGQRACYRTALELCKMLLSLSPYEDPLALVLTIDYYALRAKEYKWFIDFTYAWDSDRNLLKLPNFKYSLALAQWYMNNFDAADSSLKEALILFPSFLLLLAEKCSIQLDSKVLSHSFFTSFAESTETKALKCLVSLYVERCQHIWKNSELLPWLEKNVHAVLTAADAKSSDVTDAQIKRTTWFKANLPVNIKRHLVIYDLTSLMAGEFVPSTILVFDPFPPTNSVDLYRVSRRSVTNNPRSSGILASFFYALNPNIHYDGPDEQELEDLAEGIGEVDHELRRNLRSIVNSIRGLLTNFETENRGEAVDEDNIAEGDVEDTGSSATDQNTS